VFSVTVCIALLSSGFQRQAFPFVWVPELSPDSATSFCNSQSRSQSYFMTAGLPPISSPWRHAPWGSRPQIYFLQLNPCGHSPYVTSSLTRGRVCLLWIGFAFVKCTYRTYSMLLEILPFALYIYIYVLCQSRLCKADHACLTYTECSRGKGQYSGSS
jgi:hypothetical protein